jgi:nitroreductase
MDDRRDGVSGTPRREDRELIQLERSELLDRIGVCEGDNAHLVADLLASRFSCRAFKTTQVPEAEISRLLSIAQLSASWCNVQPWEVTVTTGEGTERFRSAILDFVNSNPGYQVSDYPLPPKYEGIYQKRRRETAWRLYESVGIAWGDRRASARQALENHRLFGAPHVMIVTGERELGPYGAIDCGIYLGNLMLAAQSMGIATIPQAAFAMIAPVVRLHLGIPDSRAVVCGMSFGYADNEHAANSFRTARSPVEEAVTWIRS